MKIMTTNGWKPLFPTPNPPTKRKLIDGKLHHGDYRVGFAYVIAKYGLHAQDYLDHLQATIEESRARRLGHIAV